REDNGVDAAVVPVEGPALPAGRHVPEHHTARSAPVETPEDELGTVGGGERLAIGRQGHAADGQVLVRVQLEGDPGLTGRHLPQSDAARVEGGGEAPAVAGQIQADQAIDVALSRGEGSFLRVRRVVQVPDLDGPAVATEAP